MYTIFGGKGFIGSHIISKLKNAGIMDIIVPEKNDKRIEGKHLGNVIYCAGLTSDFRSRPYDTIDAHVSYLAYILKNASFDSFVYVSSTRVYSNSLCGSEETFLSVKPQNPDDIFNISKLMGESICLNCRKKNIKVARISNVLGNDFSSSNFFYSILNDAFSKKEVMLKTTLNSAKDYIGINDVVSLLLELSSNDTSGIYNIASGKNTTNEQIVHLLMQATNCNIRISEEAATITFPIINIEKIVSEFGYIPFESVKLMKDLIDKYLSRKW